MAEEKGYGLLISAIVSIVAIVGMVVLFSSGRSTGAAEMSMYSEGSQPFAVRQGVMCVPYDEHCNGGQYCVDPTTGYGYCPDKSSFGPNQATQMGRENAVWDETNGIQMYSRNADGTFGTPGTYAERGLEGSEQTPAYGRPYTFTN